jgi:hypothetical protein
MPRIGSGESELDVSLGSGGQFYVSAFGRDLDSAAVNTFKRYLQFIKKFYKY